MALNPMSVRSRRTVTTEVNDLDFSGGTTGEATATVPELKHIENPADVTVQAYGSGDSDSNQGFVARVTGVGTDADGTAQITVRLYQGDADPSSAAPLQDAGVSDVDHLVIRATGL